MGRKTGRHVRRLRGNRPILLWLITALVVVAMIGITATLAVVLPPQAVQMQATATAQALSSRFARATGLVNLHRWQEAESELQAIFDSDPDYPGVQVLLATVSAETAMAVQTATQAPAATATPTQTPVPTATPTPTATASPAPTDTQTPVPTATPTRKPTATPLLASTATPEGVARQAALVESVPPPVVAPVPVQWVQIPEGSFVMGSTEAEVWAAVDACNQWEGNCQFNWFDNELPQRSEWLPAFFISQFEITNQQYRECVDAGYCAVLARISSDGSLSWDERYAGANYPVVGIAYFDAERFCSWVGGQLPSEEQWEKAARGTDSRSYPWGNTLDTGRANFYSGVLQPVGSYPSGASMYNVYDMAGNAIEWTSSNVDGKYILRGGSWHTYPFRGRTADRGTKLAPTFANYDIGFRCAR